MIRICHFFKNTALISLLLFLSIEIISATDIYVAKTGNDITGTGTLASPFLTIQKASNVSGKGYVVNVRTGVYREMVDIKADGVTFQPYNGEAVTINGADLMSSWSLSSGATYQTTMGWDVDTKWGSNQLFCDGIMIEIARWPDQTSTDVVMPTIAMADGVTSSGANYVIYDADFNEPDGRWVGAQLWINLSRNGIDGQGWTGTVISTNAAAHTITFFPGTNKDRAMPLTNTPWGVGVNTEYFLSNPTSTGVATTGGVDALLSNGEWWKDGTTLYVKTPNGAVPSATGTGTNVIESKRRHFAFWSSTTRAEYSIKGFNLFGCAITTDKDPWINRSAILEAAHDILIDGITAKYVSHQTSMTGNYQDEFYYGAGIVLRGRNNTIQNCNIQYSATAALHVSGFGNKVLNNTIANTNYMCANSGALSTGFVCLDAEIANNTIYNTTVMAINIRCSQNSNINTPDLFRIHHNTIYNFMRRSGDSGAIDEFGQNLNGMRIDHNTIYNTTPSTGGMTHGIYLDYGAGTGLDLTHVTIDHNTIYDVPSPIFMNSARFVNVYNNVALSLATSDDYGIKYGNGVSTGADNKIYNNISSSRTAMNNGIGGMPLADVRHNITITTGTQLTDLFVDAAAHNYHLKPTAVAAIDQGLTAGVYDEGIIGLPDVGAYEQGTNSDAIAPTVPSVLRTTYLYNNKFVLNWTASTDNVGGFVDYDVYKDGVLYGSTNGAVNATTYAITGLNAATTYAMTVKARDNYGNTSAASTALNVTTTTSSTIHIEAEDRSYASGGYGTTGENGKAWAGTNTGVYLQYDGVKLSGQTTFKTNVARPTVSGEKMEVRLNSSTGTVLGTLTIAATGAWTTYSQQSIALSGVPTGTYTLVIIFTNANGGACNFDWFELAGGAEDTTAPSVPVSLAATDITESGFTLSWVASTDNLNTTGYEVFKAGVSVGTTTGTSLYIPGLTCATSYAMTVRARDVVPNWSAVSAEQNVTTAACPDATAPSIPAGLSYSQLSKSSFYLTWTASTDNIGVTSYDVYKDGVLYKNTTNTNLAINGLEPFSNYSMTVIAKDLAGNQSAASSALIVTTTAANLAQQLIIYEGANYELGVTNPDPTGTTNGVNGEPASGVPTPGTGLRISWGADIKVVAGLSYGNNGYLLSSSGNALVQTVTQWGLNNPFVYRTPIETDPFLAYRSTANANLFGYNATTGATSLYFSMLMNVSLLNQGTNYFYIQGNYNLAIGQSASSKWVADGQNLGDAVAGETALIVGRINFGSGITTYDFWYNPALGIALATPTKSTSTPTTTRVDMIHFRSVANTLTVDEFRMGLSPDDVLPIAIAAPTELIVSDLGTNTFTLSWTASTTLGASYEIFKNGISIGTSTTTSFNVSSLTPNTTYSMTVKAKNNVWNYSAPSTALSVKTDISTSTNILHAAIPVYQSGSAIIVDLSSLPGLQTIAILDLQGKSLLIRQVEGGRKIFIENTLNTGVYIVNVKGLEKVIVGKLIIK